MARPLAELPPGVRADPGKISLYADFQAASDSGVPLYVVNRTVAEKKFGSQDGDIYLKLEGKADDGEWVRAQSHMSSWCGNSYVTVSLPPGQFMVCKGYRCTSGPSRPVRYRSLYIDDLVSNVGEGLADEGDIKLASLDDKTFSLLPRVFRDLLECNDQHPLSSYYPLSLRAEAARALRLFPKNTAALANAQTLREKVAGLPQSIERAGALKELDATLHYSWLKGAVKPDITALCMTQLVEGRVGLALLSQRMALSMLWNVLSRSPNVTWDPAMQEAPVWKAVLPAAVAVLKQFPDLSRTSDAAWILNSRSVTDALISDAEVEDWLRSSSTTLQECAARTLARRGKVERVITVARGLPGNHKLIALQAMLYLDEGKADGQNSGRSFEPGSSDQVFRDECMSTMPLETTLALHDAGEWFWPCRQLECLSEPWFHHPLHDYLAREAEKGEPETEMTGPRAHLHDAVLMLENLGYDEDNALLASLLKHRGYRSGEARRPVSPASPTGEVIEIVMVKHYRVRATAAAALERRKQSVPKDLVFQSPSLKELYPSRRIRVPLIPPD